MTSRAPAEDDRRMAALLAAWEKVDASTRALQAASRDMLGRLTEIAEILDFCNLGGSADIAILAIRDVVVRKSEASADA